MAGYEIAQLLNLWQSDADHFALKIEARDNGATVSTKWIDIDRATLDALLSHFNARESGS